MTHESNIAVVPTVVDEPMDFTVIARNPAEMQHAQKSLIIWAARKIQAEKELLVEAEGQLAIATKNKWATAAWKRRVKMSGEKIEYYRKIKMALEAGYYIVPPFPIDIFAIRTSRSRPKYSTSDIKRIDTDPMVLPAGEGRYVSGVIEVGKNNVYKKRADGTTDYGTIDYTWYNSREFQAVDFPFKMAKVEILDETSKAFALKIFDQFGVLPKGENPAIAVRRDPVVCGQILAPHKNKEPVTFFVAWWLNTATI